MRKTIIALVLFLFSLFLFLTLADYNSDYVAEKALWKANKKYLDYLKSPNEVPQATFEKMIFEYENFIARFPDSKLVPLAQILVGRVYSVQKDYPMARNYFDRVIDGYAERPRMSVEALLETAKSYALEEDEVNVIRTYKRVVKNYPLTDAGLQAPLLIARFFAERNENDKAYHAFNEALEYYHKLVDENPRTLVEFNALQLIASCYATQKKWREAVESFGEVLLRFPGQPLTLSQAKRIVRSINNISIYELKDYDLPVSIYEKFISENKNHPLKVIFEAMIVSLKNLKKKLPEQESDK